MLQPRRRGVFVGHLASPSAGAQGSASSPLRPRESVGKAPPPPSPWALFKDLRPGRPGSPQSSTAVNLTGLHAAAAASQPTPHARAAPAYIHSRVKWSETANWQPPPQKGPRGGSEGQTASGLIKEPL